MGKDEFTTMMQQVADTVPSQASAEIVSLIIANLILLYDQQGEWPKMMLTTTRILAEAMAEEEAENETAATEDAKTFLKNIMEDHYE
jgi:hypothetical protein|tara:strand:+ start:4361 stop:4621 length:261 start_codon:yes stop_codon:yes gene_type:complete